MKFLIQSDKPHAAIYVRFMVSKGKDLKRKTGLITDPKEWSNKKGGPLGNYKRSRDLREKLSRISTKINEAYNDALMEEKEVSGEWLDNVLTKKSEPGLSEYIDIFISDAPNKKNGKGGTGLSENRIKVLKSFKLIILRFRKDVQLTALTKDYGHSFIEWMKGQGYSQNYVAKNINNLKMFIRAALKDGYRVNEDILDISVSRKKKDVIITLSEDELNTIKKLELEGHLDNARRWLILGCAIGQRGGDLLQISRDNLRTIGDDRILEVEQQKTGKLVAVPVIPEAWEIIKDGFPTKISLQKFNLYVKKVCEEAELDTPTEGIKRVSRGGSIKGVYPKHDLIGSHVCRRTFATRFYGKIPTPIIMSVTGHERESTFLTYIGKTSYDNAFQMLEYFK